LADGSPVPAVIPAGAKLIVKLTVTCPFDRTYIAVEDWLPAGFQIVNTAFDTASQSDAEAVAKAADHQPWWGSFNHREFYDERAVFFADYMEHGVHTATYMVTVVTRGTFLLPPAKAEGRHVPPAARQGRRHVHAGSVRAHRRKPDRNPMIARRPFFAALVSAALMAPTAARALSLAELAATADAVIVADRGTPPRMTDNHLTGCPERLALVTIKDVLGTKADPSAPAAKNKLQEPLRKSAMLALKSGSSLTVRLNPAAFHACHAKLKTPSIDPSPVARYAPSDLHWMDRSGEAIFFLRWDRNTFELAADDAVEPLQRLDEIKRLVKR
jgi:hypothetical protein